MVTAWVMFWESRGGIQGSILGQSGVGPQGLTSLRVYLLLGPGYLVGPHTSQTEPLLVSSSSTWQADVGPLPPLLSAMAAGTPEAQDEPLGQFGVPSLLSQAAPLLSS